MFKIFKSKVKEAVFNKENIIQDLPVIANKMYPNEVTIIHNEFENAADKLLIEANSIIKEAESKDTQKASRLEALGFTNTSQVVDLKPLLQKAELSKEQLELLSYYKREYPLNKFITEQQVKTICHKYNLICGPVNRYKGFVPDLKLQEIEKFKLKDVDALGDIVVFIEETGKIENLNWNKIHNTKTVKYYIESYLKKNDYCYIDNESSYPKYTRLINIKNYFSNREFRIQKELQLGLQICAPVKDMDISGLEITEGYKLSKKHIPDPVVLQPVKGGYLILTKWGDEASDPILQNEINN